MTDSVNMGEIIDYLDDIKSNDDFFISFGSQRRQEFRLKAKIMLRNRKKRDAVDAECNYCGYLYRSVNEIASGYSYCPCCKSNDVHQIDPKYVYPDDFEEKV